MSKATKQRKSRLRLSMKDGAIFAVFYGAAFLAFRFDIRNYGPSFQHPMTAKAAALVALVLAILFSAYFKVRDRP